MNEKRSARQRYAVLSRIGVTIFVILILAGAGLFFWAQNYSATYLLFTGREARSRVSVMQVSPAGAVGPTEILWREIPSGVPNRAEGQLVANNDVYELQTMRYDLTDLVPDREYEFCLPPASQVVQACDWQKFRSLPAQDQELKWVVGGDLGIHFPTILKIADNFLPLEPHFIVLGGDLSYDNGNPRSTWRWRFWLKMLERISRTPTGFRVPLMVAIGNHEVNGKINENPALDMQVRAPSYFSFFNQAENRSYFTREVGASTVFLFLDSGHLVEPGGEQRTWLEAELKKYSNYQQRYAVYHVPLYPSVRDFNEPLVAAAREAWADLFSQYTLTTAFEHHDHALKVSKPLLHGQVVEKGGVLYIGDGDWGRPPRVVHPERPYLERAESRNHVWWCTTKKCLSIFGNGGASF